MIKKEKVKQVSQTEHNIKNNEQTYIQENTFRNGDDYEKEQKYLTESVRSSTTEQNVDHGKKHKKQNISQIQTIINNKQQTEDKTEMISESFLLGIFKNMKIGTLDYFKSYLHYFTCYKSDKTDLLQYCIKKIYCYTDICFFVNKLIELEKLKHLILDVDQINLFECIPKPKVGNFLIQKEEDDDVYSKQNLEISKAIDNRKYNNSNRESIVNILSVQNRSLQERIKQAQTALRKIQRRKSKRNKLDFKLIQMLDVNLIKILEEKNVNNISFDKNSVYFQQEKYQKSNNNILQLTEERKKEKEALELEQATSQNILMKQYTHPTNSSEKKCKQSQEESNADLKDEINQIQRVYSHNNVSIIPHHLSINDIKHMEDGLHKPLTITQINNNDISQISLCDKSFEIQHKYHQPNTINQNE